MSHFSVLLFHTSDVDSIMAKRSYEATEEDGADMEFESHFSLKEAEQEYKTYIEKNGDETQNYGPVNWYISGDRPIHANAVPITLAPTEYFSVIAQQGSGAVKSLLFDVGPSDSLSTKISVMRVA